MQPRPQLWDFSNYATSLGVHYALLSGPYTREWWTLWGQPRKYRHNVDNAADLRSGFPLRERCWKFMGWFCTSSDFATVVSSPRIVSKGSNT